jgi:hypothetical protein
VNIAGTTLKCTLAAIALVFGSATSAATGGTSGVTPQGSPAVPLSAVLPSIEILPNQSHLAGACGNSTFDLNTAINVDSHSSADVRLTVAGSGTIEDFTDETGSNVGPFSGNYPTFQILSFGGGLPPNTAINITITTYTGPALSGKQSYLSSLIYNCTSGAILSLANATSGTESPIPTVSRVILSAIAGLLLLFGMVALPGRAVGIRR